MKSQIDAYHQSLLDSGRARVVARVGVPDRDPDGAVVEAKVVKSRSTPTVTVSDVAETKSPDSDDVSA